MLLPVVSCLKHFTFAVLPVWVQCVFPWKSTSCHRCCMLRTGRISLNCVHLTAPCFDDHSTWILSVSPSLWTLTRCSCPLARFLPLARKTSASLLCCSLYLTSKCPLEQRALDFSTGFYTVKSHRLTTVNMNRNINMRQKPMCFATTKLHLKRIKTLSSMKQNKTWK